VPRIQLTLTLPHELVEQFDQVAERQDRSRSKMVEIAMRKYLVEEAAA
jgi:metal-responsive CopG/Arc/MetJ family transcriptional regulator